MTKRLRVLRRNIRRVFWGKPKRLAFAKLARTTRRKLPVVAHNIDLVRSELERLRGQEVWIEKILTDRPYWKGLDLRVRVDWIAEWKRASRVEAIMGMIHRDRASYGLFTDISSIEDEIQQGKVFAELVPEVYEQILATVGLNETRDHIRLAEGDLTRLERDERVLNEILDLVHERWLRAWRGRRDLEFDRREWKEIEQLIQDTAWNQVGAIRPKLSDSLWSIGVGDHLREAIAKKV